MSDEAYAGTCAGLLFQAMRRAYDGRWTILLQNACDGEHMSEMHEHGEREHRRTANDDCDGHHSGGLRQLMLKSYAAGQIPPVSWHNRVNNIARTRHRPYAWPYQIAPEHTVSRDR
ncbi:unnamed protein product [Cercospora beticola]|nr:unnamed protein product [Cercospora beticola]